MLSIRVILKKMNKLIFVALMFDPICKFEYMQFSFNSMFELDKWDVLFQMLLDRSEFDV